MRRITAQSGEQSRRGFLTPLVAFAILAVMASAALVLDSLWLEAASVELQRCAEAAALAAARELACDERLRSDDTSPEPLERARRVAAAIAASNLVAGRPVRLDTDERGDIRFGRLVTGSETGRTLFVETRHSPTTAVVTARCTRRRNNPVALLLRTASGTTSADVVARAEATLDNRVIGLRAYEGVPIPALPLAILKSHSHAATLPAWDTQVEQRLGPDQFAFDPETGRIDQASDGLPEIVLLCQISADAAAPSNACLVDFGTECDSGAVVRQIYDGINQRDLDAYGGALVSNSEPILLAASSRLSRDVVGALEEIVGATRICLLYDEPADAAGRETVRWAGLAAARVMSVRQRFPDSWEIVLQPAVVVTSAVVLADRASGISVPANRYIYKLQLTQ